MTLAARDALLQMVDWLVNNKGLTREQAYCLSSVAVDLRIGNLVDTPNFAVSAILDLGVFDATVAMTMTTETPPQVGHTFHTGRARMNRRSLRVTAASGLWLVLTAHSPYRQWEVYRKVRLVVLVNAEERRRCGSVR